MTACSRCGGDNPLDARFCNACGAPLAAVPAVAREERKLVTVLFADLVGFTSRSEHLDPEDVRALLTPYYAGLRMELERHGGTVEKFIGDAVMAVFGAPRAHEDDPERAVRAALAIRDWVRRDASDLQVRIAVTTGEALVTLGARPVEGEGMVAGDVVNTAARLQAAAPVNGILVGDRTERATRHVIDYRRAAAVEAKGKAEPVRAWEVLDARSRLGVDVDPAAGPLVGRRRELDLLRDALGRVRDEHRAQLVTIVGVPGIGKSRLVAELRQLADADPDLITWRQGRSLPYGDGVTYWALSEMIKLHCGILDTDPVEAAAGKLAAAVTQVLPDPAEVGSTLAHLQPLVGLGGEVEPALARRSWRGFFEALAARTPLVLVFEDLHWADDSLLDFVDHLVDWAAAVPLLVVCTARPELLERRPAWGGGKGNASTLSLTALSQHETARLVSSLLDRRPLPADAQQDMLARIGGNPLFTEQFVRMLVEREGRPAELPETVQGIIAARLDGLAAADKALLQAAAVLGKVFWSGAVAAVADADVAEVEDRLHALERREFVRRQHRSSMGGQTEYAFGHGLLRDVAYAELPRSGRAERHRVAAEWIASLGRVGDHAELLAHHYEQAVAYARTSGQPSEALERRARHALRDAGLRGLALGALPAAARHFEAAVALTPAADPERPGLLLLLGRSRPEDRLLDDGVLEEAAAGLLAAGDRNGAAEAHTMLAMNAWQRGVGIPVRGHLDRAAALIDRQAVTPQRVLLLSNIARIEMLSGEPERAVQIAQDALPLAVEVGRRDVEARLVVTLGTSRGMAGDPAGMADIERALRLCEDPALLHVRWQAWANLGSIQFEYGDVRGARQSNRTALREAEEAGDPVAIDWFEPERAGYAYYTGDVAEAEAVLRSLPARGFGEDRYMAVFAGEVHARMVRDRGDRSGALAEAEAVVARARTVQDPQILLPAMGLYAVVLTEAGRRDQGAAVCDELLGLLRGSRAVVGVPARVDLGWALRALGRGEDLLAVVDEAATVWFAAAAAIARDDLAEALAQFERMGVAPEAARTRTAMGSSRASAQG